MKSERLNFHNLDWKAIYKTGIDIKTIKLLLFQHKLLNNNL